MDTDNIIHNEIIDIYNNNKPIYGGVYDQRLGATDWRLESDTCNLIYRNSANNKYTICVKCDESAGS
jgi:hypothetical protein